MTTITPTDIATAEAERAAVYKVASDMILADRDPGLIAAYLREEARRHPAAFVTDWTPFIECPCGNLTDSPTVLAATCGPDCDELEVLWAHVAKALRASVQPVTVTRGGMDRPDARLLPLTGDLAGWQ